jgi:hypothetical protein
MQMRCWRGHLRDVWGRAAETLWGALFGIIASYLQPPVAGVEEQSVNGPDLDLVGLSRRFLRERMSPSDRDRLEVPFEGCPLRWPGEPSL